MEPKQGRWGAATTAVATRRSMVMRGDVAIGMESRETDRSYAHPRPSRVWPRFPAELTVATSSPESLEDGSDGMEALRCSAKLARQASTLSFESSPNVLMSENEIGGGATRRLAVISAGAGRVLFGGDFPLRKEGGSCFRATAATLAPSQSSNLSKVFARVEAIKEASGSGSDAVPSLAACMAA